MDEQNLLSRLRHGDEQALAAAIAQYSAYVVTVILTAAAGFSRRRMRDELASSVFHALAVLPDGEVRHLRAWLGASRGTRQPSTGCGKAAARYRWTRIWPERTIFFLRKPRSENRRSSSAPLSRSYQRQTARSSAGFMIYVNRQ